MKENLILDNTGVHSYHFYTLDFQNIQQKQSNNLFDNFWIWKKEEKSFLVFFFSKISIFALDTTYYSMTIQDVWTPTPLK